MCLLFQCVFRWEKFILLPFTINETCMWNYREIYNLFKANIRFLSRQGNSVKLNLTGSSFVLSKLMRNAYVMHTHEAFSNQTNLASVLVQTSCAIQTNFHTKVNRYWFSFRKSSQKSRSTSAFSGELCLFSNQSFSLGRDFFVAFDWKVFTLGNKNKHRRAK